MLVSKIKTFYNATDEEINEWLKTTKRGIVDIHRYSYEDRYDNGDFYGIAQVTTIIYNEEEEDEI